MLWKSLLTLVAHIGMNQAVTCGEIDWRTIETVKYGNNIITGTHKSENYFHHEKNENDDNDDYWDITCEHVGGSMFALHVHKGHTPNDIDLCFDHLSVVFENSSNKSVTVCVKTTKPTNQPTSSPTKRPTKSPSKTPTYSPTHSPTSKPTDLPTSKPTHSPTSKPTHLPTSKPTHSPTSTPTHSPTSEPTKKPTSHPTLSPTANPTDNPTFGSYTQKYNFYVDGKSVVIRHWANQYFQTYSPFKSNGNGIDKFQLTSQFKTKLGSKKPSKTVAFQSTSTGKWLRIRPVWFLWWVIDISGDTHDDYATFYVKKWQNSYQLIPKKYLTKCVAIQHSNGDYQLSLMDLRSPDAEKYCKLDILREK